MTDDEANARIDAQLRKVAIPPGFIAQLRGISQWSDAELDGDLSNGEVPVRLAANLRTIPVDSSIDQEVAETSIPERLRTRLRAIPRRSQYSQQFAGQLVAALLMATVGLGYTSFALQLLAGARRPPLPDPVFAFVRPAPTQLEAQNAETNVLVADFMDDALKVASNSEETTEVAAAIEPWKPTTVERRQSAPIEKVFAAVEERKLDSSINRHIYGAQLSRPEDVPQLDLVRLPQPRGIITPLVPGYDRGFLLRTGIHPPVVPAMNRTLQQSLAPLSMATDSLDAVLASALRKNRILPEQVRTEDFIAAIDHELPKPASGELSLAIQVSPSRFGPEPARLLSVGVRAGEANRRERSSTHLVVAIDFSAGLAASGNWPWTRDAILETVARLGPQDRISLVFFQDEVLMASSPLDRGSLDLLRDRLTSYEPQGDVDEIVGLEAALDVALAAETPAKSRQIVLLTDGHFDISTRQQRQLRRLSSELTRSSIGMELINLGGPQNISSGPELVSEALRIKPRSVASRRGLVQGLIAILHGDEALVATDAKAIVKFAPDAVAAYRLIGHEANTMAQLIPPAQVVELHANDAALTLFELLPIPNSKAETIAEVELSWTEPESGKRRTLQRSVSRSELAQTWDSAPASFRAAAIAAETAEQLRGSRSSLRELNWYRSEAVDFRELAAQARALSTSTTMPSLQPLVRLLDVLSNQEPDHGTRSR